MCNFSLMHLDHCEKTPNQATDGGLTAYFMEKIPKKELHWMLLSHWLYWMLANSIQSVKVQPILNAVFLYAFSSWNMPSVFWAKTDLRPAILMPWFWILFKCVENIKFVRFYLKFCANSVTFTHSVFECSIIFDWYLHQIIVFIKIIVINLPTGTVERLMFAGTGFGGSHL